MRLLVLTLALVAAGCASAPPPADPPAALVAPAPPPVSTPEPPPLPPDPEPEATGVPASCRPHPSADPYAFQIGPWIESASPLLGCPSEALDAPGWRLADGRATRVDGVLSRLEATSPDDPVLSLAIDLLDGRVVRVERRMTPDAQRVVSFFRFEAAFAPDHIGDDPVLDLDDRQVYAPSDERPYWIDFHRTPDAIVAVLVDAEAEPFLPDLDAPEPAAEADALAAGGRPCDAPFTMRPESLHHVDFDGPADFDVLSARLGCPYDEALADLGLSAPAETVTAPDGTILAESFTSTGPDGRPRVISVERREDRMASIALGWPGEETRRLHFVRVKALGIAHVGAVPDLEEDDQVMWFDDEDLRYGVVVGLNPQAAFVQLIDARWF